MQGDRIPLVKDGDALDVDDENRHRQATNGLLGMGVSEPMTLTWIGGSPMLGCNVSSEFEWFYTTSAITTASASATGTALGSATMTDGFGTARPCVESGSGTSWTRTPDTSASDQTIYCPVVTATAIAAGSYVLCALVAGRWLTVLTIRCPGT